MQQWERTCVGIKGNTLLDTVTSFNAQFDGAHRKPSKLKMLNNTGCSKYS